MDKGTLFYKKTQKEVWTEIKSYLESDKNGSNELTNGVKKMTNAAYLSITKSVESTTCKRTVPCELSSNHLNMGPSQ